MNLKSALERLGGDEELLDDLIGFYLEDYPSLIQTIDESLAAGDSALVERAAHSLKSLAANFDATRCNELAQNIESAAKKQELQSLGEQVAQLHICTDELAQALVAHRDGRKS
jgi:HPt (histidine-containing phosphotransfer) domain-containing protein